MPFDYFCSAVFLLLSAWAAPWYVTLLVSIPLGFYNFRSYLRKDHRLYFITKREYQQNFSKMESQFKFKSVYYGILTAGALVMMILALIDFMEKLI